MLFVIALQMIMQTFGDPRQHRTRLSRPTFTEFIQYIINEHLNGRTMDMHWEPVYKFCTPCQFKFSHIIKMETFERDQRVILEKAGVSFTNTLVQSPKSTSKIVQKDAVVFLSSFVLRILLHVFGYRFCPSCLILAIFLQTLSPFKI